MIIDGALQFTGTAGTVSGDSPTTGTQNSTNIIDLLNARDLGITDDPSIKILAQVMTAFAGGTSLQLELRGAPDNGSGVPGTWTTYATGPVILTAGLVVGARLMDHDLPRKASGAALPRFLQLRSVADGTFDAGAYFASLVLDRDDYVVYPAGMTVQN